jgi:TRAP-type C4-dicarboxylate transport system permease small subunit
MGSEKVSFRKSATSATSLVLTLLFVMALFYGGFYYISSNFQSAGIPLDSKYQNMSTQLEASQTKLESDATKISSAVQNISQAPSNLPYVAFYGLVGIASAISSLWNLLDTTLDVWTALVPGLGFLPQWVSGLVLIGIIMTVVFILFRIFTGRTDI